MFIFDQDLSDRIRSTMAVTPCPNCCTSLKPRCINCFTTLPSGDPRMLLRAAAFQYPSVSIFQKMLLSQLGAKPDNRLGMELRNPRFRYAQDVARLFHGQLIRVV